MSARGPLSLRALSLRGWVAMLALGLSSLASQGCAKLDDGPATLPAPQPATAAASTCACESDAPVVDTALLAFLSKARALHHQADMAEERRDVDGAITALERIFSPAPDRPEAHEVIADTRARLAELRASRGDLEAASKDIDQGLERASSPSYFRGHLLQVRGLIEERRAKAADKAGDRAGAEAARKRAVEASEQAVKIQEEVIRKALDAPGARP